MKIKPRRWGDECNAMGRLPPAEDSSDGEEEVSKGLPVFWERRPVHKSGRFVDNCGKMNGWMGGLIIDGGANLSIGPASLWTVMKG